MEKEDAEESRGGTRDEEGAGERRERSEKERRSEQAEGNIRCSGVRHSNMARVAADSLFVLLSLARKIQTDNSWVLCTLRSTRTMMAS